MMNIFNFFTPFRNSLLRDQFTFADRPSSELQGANNERSLQLQFGLGHQYITLIHEYAANLNGRWGACRLKDCTGTTFRLQYGNDFEITKGCGVRGCTGM
jgi:hypothetical protein